MSNAASWRPSALRTGAPFVAAALLAAAPGAFAQTPALDLEIKLEADASEIDRANDRLIFHDISISQGPLSVRASRAEGSGLEFDDSDWVFSGDVRIRDLTTSIAAEKATLRFVDHRLRNAILNGAPVRFEHRRSAGANDAGGSVKEGAATAGAPPDGGPAGLGAPGRTVGRADEIEYDFEAQLLRLSGDAWLSEGTNQISSASIVYDIIAQRVKADSNGDGDDRVRITITPPADALDNASDARDERSDADR